MCSLSNVQTALYIIRYVRAAYMSLRRPPARLPSSILKAEARWSIDGLVTI